MFRDEVREHLEQKIIPFWQNLKDDVSGGFTGYVGEDLCPDKTADKGCILNSRILWTFSTAAKVLDRDDLRAYAEQAYRFTDRFEDPENGGVYWSVTYDGKPADTTKHTYCQAFAVYGLAAYYRLTGCQGALRKAVRLFRVIEEKCRDEKGYLEALNADFTPGSNEKLSENGVMASRTMNTLLHVIEAYAELYRAYPDEEVRLAGEKALRQCLDTIYNPAKRRMEVFFDDDFRPLLDMQSYGHDIDLLNMPEGCPFAPRCDNAMKICLTRRCERMRLNEYYFAACWMNVKEGLDLAESATERGFTDHGLHYEIVNGEVNTIRAWWPQAEAMLGFAFALEITGDAVWAERMRTQWNYILRAVVDPREGSEWLNEITEEGESLHKPLAEEWKCPYHNGRMCLRLYQLELPEGL